MQANAYYYLVTPLFCFNVEIFSLHHAGVFSTMRRQFERAAVLVTPLFLQQMLLRIIDAIIFRRNIPTSPYAPR